MWLELPEDWSLTTYQERERAPWVDAAKPWVDVPQPWLDVSKPWLDGARVLRTACARRNRGGSIREIVETRRES